MNVLLATIPSDSHSWNMVYMQLFIEEHGHKVCNLGPCTPLDLIVESVISQQADLIVISSINGHANIEGVQIAHALSESASTSRIPKVIGGKLGTLGAGNIEYVDQLKKAGFEEVFHDQSAVDAFSGFLKVLRERMISGDFCAA